jgi:RES domain-containing protein
VHLQSSSFYRRVRKVLRDNPGWQKPWTGVVFRSVPLEFARPDQIVDGIGAMQAGGRWNPPRTMRVLYCSLNPGTAAEESMRLFEGAGFNGVRVKPRLIVGIRYRLRFVLGLEKVLSECAGLDLDQLMEEDWKSFNDKGSETCGQALGRALFHSNVEGFLTPSARVTGAMNLVVFPENLRKASRQTVLEEADLRAWLKQS